MKEKIHLLAISYFEGKISLEDESILSDFISKSKMNERIFHKWETEWILKMETENSYEQEWNSLQSRLITRQAVRPLFKTKQISIFKKIASVAAIILITVASTVFTYNLFSPSAATKLFTVESPVGEKSRITLPDGTLVWLNSSSKISYNASFGNSERIVKLDGEAYFQVTKQSNIPFTVKTNGYDVVVKGTKFNVSSYGEDNKSSTTLMEGKVEIIYQGEILDMNPGELIEINSQTHKISKSFVDTDQYKSWIDNKIEYDTISLDELFRRLSRQHNVNIQFNSAQMESKILSISIHNDESIDEILTGISNVIPLTINKKNHDIYVKLK